MRCEKCNVEITCKTEVCPLCHSPLHSEGEVAFPVPSAKKVFPKKFLLVYFLIALVANIVCITVNLVIGTKSLWCIEVLVSSIYLYHFINVTVISRPRWHKNVLGQMIVLTVLFVIVRLTIGGNHWIFITWLPALYMASDILMIIFMVKQGAEAPKYLATFLFICLLGVIPTISAYAFDLSVKIPSIVATCLSGALFLSSLFIWRKNILHELKKAFHA